MNDAVDVEMVDPDTVQVMSTFERVDAGMPDINPATNKDSGEPGNAQKDIRTFFGATSQVGPAEYAPWSGLACDNDGNAKAGMEDVLSAFNLSVSSIQDVSESMLTHLNASSGGRIADSMGHQLHLKPTILAEPFALTKIDDIVPLLITPVPLMSSGRAILAQLPQQWIDIYGRSDAFGTRCLFASRRHEHSVFAPIPPEGLLRVPPAVQEWQPSLDVCLESLDAARLAEEEPWSMQLHPARGTVRVLLRPGALLARMLRRGTAMPAAWFSWHVTDAPLESRIPSCQGSPVQCAGPGEFSILSNIEDAAHGQPPHFFEFPLRREQLRSLGWMISQETRRHLPFVAELHEAAPCSDAPHWRIEGRLHCEYTGVKGGVLADAIGYGKTACTIGLVDCTRSAQLPEVPAQFAGFIPTRATLILVPTNLHAQWLGEINKFCGTVLTVISVPTCAQLKRLTLEELMEADIVLVTYRLFYSSPYLHRLEELAQTERPGFAFPKCRSGTGGRQRAALAAKWSHAYRTAFEALPAWTAQYKVSRSAGIGEAPPGSGSPETPARARAVPPASSTMPATPAKARSFADNSTRRVRGKTAVAAAKEKSADDGLDTPEAAVSRRAKRRRLLGKQAAEAPEGIARSCAWAAWLLEMEFVPLEALWWKRVVCDEFHELLSRYPPAQVAVELFHADYKWGLSGTPPCQTLAQIRRAAGFLGVQIPASAPNAGGDAIPRRVAQDWLDAFVRRNTAELAPFEEEERIVPVRQTPKERALYLALTGQGTQSAAAPDPLIQEPPEFQAARSSTSGLLKLCSHFGTCGAAEVLTAADECERQLALRREQVRLVEKEVRTLAQRATSTLQLVRHFEPHFCHPPERADFGFICREPKSLIAARLQFLGAPASGTKAELLGRLFGSPTSPGAAATAAEDVKEMALRVDFNPMAARPGQDPAKPQPSWAAIEAAAAGDPGAGHAGPDAVHELVARAVREALAAGSASGAAAPPTRCVRLRSGLGMPPCLDRHASAEHRRSSDGGFTLEEQTWQWLAEADNAEKLRKVTNAWKSDIERFAVRLLQLGETAAVKLKDLHSFQQTLQATQDTVNDSVEDIAPHFAKYGSKIQALVKHIQRLQREDAHCKIICFVQWEDLKRKISAALEEFDVRHLSLHGSVWGRRDTLTRFQYDEDSPRILLLSLEESASGTNLTASNHVIIVHPMEAATREEAVAFEMQAVGRVRRPGQQRKIHIWRFVTVGTIEQRITEEHQRDLWERQRTQILVTPGSPCAGSEEEEEEAEGIQSIIMGDERAKDALGMCATQQYLGGEAADTAADLATQRCSMDGDGCFGTQTLPMLRG